MASSRKYGPGWSGQGYGQFDKGLNSEMWGFGRMASSRKYGPGRSGPGYGHFDKGLNREM